MPRRAVEQGIAHEACGCARDVHVGAGGTTEPGETSARVGVELGALFHLGLLYAEAHVMLNGTELVANSVDPDAAVSAPPRIVTGGLVCRFDDDTFGAIRVRHESPAREEAFTIVEAELGRRIGPIELALNAQNNEPEDLGPQITVRGTIAADF